MYSAHAIYVCIPGMYVIYEWTDGTDGAISELLFFGAISIFLYKPNERKYSEILFIWTLAKRVRNARVPFSWTYQFVDVAGICL